MDADDLSPGYRLRDCSPGSVPPVILASPHSGRAYPREFLDKVSCTEADLRRAEDAWVDRLVAPAADALGLPLLAAHWGRTFIDLNRDPRELDEAIIPDAPKVQITDRLRAGLGVLPRVATPGVPLYSGKLSYAEARRRIERVHVPYHAALARLIRRAQAAHGYAVLVDCHSMPPLTGRGGVRAPEIVLGDRHGASACSAVTTLLEHGFSRCYQVRRNAPYAGGYTTAHYGRPAASVHAVQVEVARSLYMDLDSFTPAAGFAAVASAFAGALRQLLDGLAAPGLMEAAE